MDSSLCEPVLPSCFSVLHNASCIMLEGGKAGRRQAGRREEAGRREGGGRLVLRFSHGDCTMVLSFVTPKTFPKVLIFIFLHFCAFMMQYFTFLIKFVFSLWWLKKLEDSSRQQWHPLLPSAQDPLNSGVNFWSCFDVCVTGAVCPH